MAPGVSGVHYSANMVVQDMYKKAIADADVCSNDSMGDTEEDAQDDDT